MIQKFTKTLLALAMLLSLVADATTSAVSRLPQLADISSEGDLEEILRRQCCCANAICVGSTDNPVGPQGSIFFDPVAQAIFLSTGTGRIEIADTEPAPAVITVNPSFTNPNNVTQFTTIQAAIDSLGNKKIIDTTITIAAGTYTENLVLQSVLNSDAYKLKLIGDPRRIVGVGIANNSYWNLDPTAANLALGGVGGGVGSVAVISGVAGTNTISVTNSGGGINPDFTVDVRPGDRVHVVSDSGSFNIYTIAAVAPTVLTLTSNLVSTIGTTATTLGGSITILPNVVINPADPTQFTFSCAGMCKISGLYFESFVDTHSLVHVRSYGLLLADNSVFKGGQNNISMFTPLPSTTTDPGVIVYATFETTTFYGVTTLQPSGVSGNRNSIVNWGGFLSFKNSLAVTPFTSPGAAVSLRDVSTANLTGSKLVGNLFVQTSRVSLIPTSPVGANLDIIRPSGGDGITLLVAELVAGGLLSVIIRGAPSTGIFALGSSIKIGVGANLSLRSTAGSFVGLELDTTYAQLPLTTITIPAGALSFIARISSRSTLELTNVTGVNTIGANSNGFLVQNNSELDYYAGSIASDVTSTSGTLFDVRSASRLLVRAPATKTFSNYQTMFTFDDNSNGTIFNVITTTTTNGVNVNATNGSKVEVDTATFNPAGANIGLQTSFGGYIFRKNGAIITNNAGVPTSGGVQTFADQIGNYTASHASGLIVV